ncbi:TPA: hypothetical protein ACIVON_005429, partial [Salmonella enterica subsp. enterica serovar Poona]
YDGEFNGYEDRRMGTLKTITLLALQHIFGITRGSRATIGGFRRSIMNFTGVREMHVYQGNHNYRVYTFNYFKSWSIIFKFIKLNIKMKFKSKELKAEILKFREEKSKFDSWRDIFNRE